VMVGALDRCQTEGIEIKRTPRELMRLAMYGEPTERIPTMPQIVPSMALRVYESEYRGDWIDGLRRYKEDPNWAYEYVIQLVEVLDCDGLRLFIEESPGRIERAGDELVVLDPERGHRIGRIDIMSGGGFIPDRPAPPVETLEEAKDRLEGMIRQFGDEKIEWLRKVRQKITNRFVASMPGYVTIDTYCMLRGQVQAMMDFSERPEFVKAVMEMQSEAMIERAQRLLTTGIDALYIGDPSASMIGPRHFEQFCMPPLQTFCRHFKDRNIPIYIHVCGNANPILEMLAESGVQVVEPLDPLGGVSVADAKRRIGDRVALMGGVSTDTLRWGLPDQVTAEAVQKCREGGPHGFILAAGCQIPPETPLENLRSMVNVATRTLWKSDG
jgi:hypothetical protein